MRVLLLSIKKEPLRHSRSVCLSVCLDMDMMECGGYIGAL